MRSAVKVFARRGLQRGAIDEVVADAGFTKGAFYANFSSKDELLLAMLDEGFAVHLREVVRELSGRVSGVDGSEIVQQARMASEDYARHLAAEPDWQRLFFEFVVHATRDEPFHREFVSRYGELRAGVAEVFARRAAEFGVSSPVEVEHLTRMVFAMANGFSLERMLEPEAASEESYGTMVAIFFAGLGVFAQEAGLVAAREAEVPRA
jgi:AcrR family transcriptional regulator